MFLCLYQLSDGPIVSMFGSLMKILLFTNIYVHYFNLINPKEKKNEYNWVKWVKNWKTWKTPART